MILLKEPTRYIDVNEERMHIIRLKLGKIGKCRFTHSQIENLKVKNDTRMRARICFLNFYLQLRYFSKISI
jgi:ubiquinone/menaquinone biosynthesis C-methylase UbiE